MNDSPNRILRIFSNIGIAQIVPVILSLLFIVFFIGAAFIFMIYAPIGQGGLSSNESILTIFLFSLSNILCIWGLIAFLLSSYRFIRANSRRDYLYITKGMRSLNWASFFLTLFTVVSVVLTALGLILYS